MIHSLLLNIVASVRNSNADSPVSWQFGFQDPASPVMQGIISLHHHIFYFVVAIVVFVLWMLYRTVKLFSAEVHPEVENINHNTVLEVVWTLTPAFILVIIGIPSFSLLYASEELIDPAMTLKCVGHQWYWSYEYSDYGDEGISFDSYMVAEEDLEEGQLRLLEVDNRVVLPINTHIRLIITATDVIHSWAVPSLGIKLDAVPGRLNQAAVFINRPGVFYGQCSEICGVNHGFMPIVVEGVSVDDYMTWVQTMLDDA